MNVSREMNSLSSLRGLAWAAWSTAAFVVALVASVGSFSVIHWFVDVPHAVDMALWPPVWGGLSLIGVEAAGRIAFGRWLRPNLVASSFAIAGIVLSSIVLLAVQQWTIGRFGYPDPDFVGATAWLFAALVALAVATFAALVAPARAVLWPLIACLWAAFVVLVMVASNIPALADGIADDSWPLAASVALASLYALFCPALVLRAQRARAALST